VVSRAGFSETQGVGMAIFGAVAKHLNAMMVMIMIVMIVTLQLRS
jgi:hypothetical protein